MRAWVFAGERRMQLENRPLPIPGPRDVRIRVAFAGICGSDIHGYAGESGFRHRGVIMGHEASGVVDAVGQCVDGIALGDHVTFIPTLPCDGSCGHSSANRCDRLRIVGVAADAPGAFADYVVVPASRVRQLGSVPLELGALVEPLAVGLHAVRRAASQGGGRALILGGGMIGQAAAIAARLDGAAEVIVSDPLESRRHVSENLGFATVDPAHLRGGEMFDYAVDAVGIPATLSTAVHAVRRGGCVSVVGLGLPTAEITMFDIVGYERIVTGSAAYTDDDFEEMLGWVGDGRIDTAPISRRSITLDEVGEALEQLATGTETAVKVTLSLLVE